MVLPNTPLILLPQTAGDSDDDDSDDMWDESEDESSSDDEVPAIGYTAAYFLKK